MTVEFIIFTLIGIVLAVLSLLTVITPLWRGRKDTQSGSTDIDIYRDQLDEVERDLARGVLDVEEAERTRTEISRRVLAADCDARAQSGDAPEGLSRGVAVVLGVAILTCAGGLYAALGAPGYGDIPRAERIAIGEDRRANRPSQLDAEVLAPIVDTFDQFDEDTRGLIQTRRASVFEDPQNADAWRVLAQTEAAIGQFQRAARAQEQVVTLRGDAVRIEDRVDLLDLLVAATQGYVSPQAEGVALSVLQQDPNNIPAMYYAGLMYAQNDRPDRAFALWRRVVEEGPQDSLHWDFASRQIEDVALQLGMDYVVPDRRGPSAQDLEMAENMAPDDRRAMIEGMVGQLADRLASEGGPPQDWARLISSLMVIEQQDAARRVLDEAELIFGGDVQAVTIIRRAATEAGLTQ